MSVLEVCIKAAVNGRTRLKRGGLLFIEMITCYQRSMRNILPGDVEYERVRFRQSEDSKRLQTTDCQPLIVLIIREMSNRGWMTHSLHVSITVG
jgi:hypothetical protein